MVPRRSRCCAGRVTVPTLDTGTVTAGLTVAEAERRLVHHGPNELSAARRRTLARQVWQVVREPMLLLLIAAATVNFALADPFDGVILMVAVLFVIAISIVQSRRTENALAALALVLICRVRVSPGSSSSSPIISTGMIPSNSPAGILISPLVER